MGLPSGCDAAEVPRLAGQMESVRRNYQLKKEELNKRMKVNINDLNRQNKKVQENLGKVKNNMNKYVQEQTNRARRMNKLNKDIANMKTVARNKRSQYQALKNKIRQEKPRSNFSFNN